ncbi:MAG: hypothetical protein HY615_07635 [Candidatus Rokubacteria bacterium]|nr:hypothetical protein [Candidatus Rokubacteria bacterium]
MGLVRWSVGAVAAVVVAGLFLIGLAAKERDNRFCVACHLHDEKLDRLTAAKPIDLAGFHYRRDASAGCIACHGGADLAMRTKVWAVATFDTVKFFAGWYEEPTRMRLELRDAECRQCHTPVLKSAPRGAIAPAPTDSASAPPGNASAEMYATDPYAERDAGANYHAVREHETVKLGCIRCHSSHTSDGGAKDRFISQARVRPLCGECHKEMLEAASAVR